MINTLIDSFCRLLLNNIDSLPDMVSFDVPDGVYDGINSMMSFVGWLMPYSLYAPLIAFILALTSFRIFYAIYHHFKK